MIETRARTGFELMAMNGAGDAGALARGLRREVTRVGLQALAAKLLHAAVASPGRMADIYDNAANGWLSGPLFTPSFRGAESLKPDAAFWTAFWSLLETPPAQRRRLSFTVEAIRLAGLLGPDLQRQVAAAASDVPGIRAATAAGPPPRLDRARLRACPPSTLGGAVWLEMQARGMPDDVVDRERLGLSALPSPLDVLNVEALEHHVVWAVVGGYSPAQLDELALAGFQMGQFRHHHSAMILGLTMATVAFDRPAGLEVVLDSIFHGWLHGRETPLLIGCDWNDLLTLPVEAVRERLGVRTFRSPLMTAMRRIGEGGLPPR